jgi:hypothetical protein
MGEISEDIFDGIICSSCQRFIGNPVGYPRKCKSCHKQENIETNTKRTASLKKVACPTCKKKVKPAGLADHIRDKHSQNLI